jgi:hypothetical protein
MTMLPIRADLRSMSLRIGLPPILTRSGLPEEAWLFTFGLFQRQMKIFCEGWFRGSVGIVLEETHGAEWLTPYLPNLVRQLIISPEGGDGLEQAPAFTQHKQPAGRAPSAILERRGGPV